MIFYLSLSLSFYLIKRKKKLKIFHPCPSIVIVNDIPIQTISQVQREISTMAGCGYEGAGHRLVIITIFLK
jgi:hypothetical protein